MVLFDTNIVIYLLQKDEGIFQQFPFLLKEEQYGLSMISRLEVLLGARMHGMDLSEMEGYLDDFWHYEISKEVVMTAAKLSQNSKKKLAYRDLVIAATALIHRLPLLSSDKDFQKVPGLEVFFFDPPSSRKVGLRRMNVEEE